MEIKTDFLSNYWENINVGLFIHEAIYFEPQEVREVNLLCKMLVMECSVSHVVGNYSITELYPQSKISLNHMKMRR